MTKNKINKIKSYLDVNQVPYDKLADYRLFVDMYIFDNHVEILDGLTKEEFLRFQFLNNQWIDKFILHNHISYHSENSLKRAEHAFNRLQEYLDEESISYDEEMSVSNQKELKVFNLRVSTPKFNKNDDITYSLTIKTPEILRLIKFISTEKSKVDNSVLLRFELKYFNSPFKGYVKISEYAPIIFDVKVITETVREYTSFDLNGVEKEYNFYNYKPIFTNKSVESLGVILVEGNCLPIELDLYNRIQLKGRLPKGSDVFRFLRSQKILITNKFNRPFLINEFRRHKVDKNVPDINYESELIRKTYNDWYNSFFLEGKKKFKRPSNMHKYIESNSRNLENSKFGIKLEKAVYNYFVQKRELVQQIDKRNLKASIIGVSSSIMQGEVKLPFIKWHNKEGESFEPVDIECVLDEKYLIEVKASRFKENGILYFSIKELKLAIEHEEHYIIAHGAIIEDDEDYNGIILHDDFCLNFYRFANDTLEEIKNNIGIWEEYHESNKIRISLQQLESINEQHKVETKTESRKHYIEEVEDYSFIVEFIKNYYFDDIRRLISEYNLHEIVKDIADFNSLETEAISTLD